jgi:hypothetical protein
MYTIHKTRENQGVYFALLPFAVLVAAAVLTALAGLKTGFTFLSIIFWVYALYSLLTMLRTRNIGFLVAALFQISAGLQIYYHQIIRQPDMKARAIALSAVTLFFLVCTFALVVTKKLRWRGREILELAAAPLEDIGNGYTARPMPAGRTDFTRQQVEDFARFARHNLMAVIYSGKDRTVFVPVVNGREAPFLLGMKSDYTQETWVSIDNSGNLSVNISQRDYLMYKETYAFDQLCTSLANLFVEFISLYSSGESVRIINRLNDVNFFWLS